MFLYLWMILQIVCESLPISSSGHVQLQQYILAKYQFCSDVNFWINYDLYAFDYILQGLSAIIIFCYFFSYWWLLIVQRQIAFSSLLHRDLWMKTVPHVFLFGFLADSITFIFWKYAGFEKFYFPCVSSFYLGFGFIITGTVLWSLQWTREKNIDIWSWKNGLLVGAVQGLSLFPGISRFGSTIAVLQWLGYQRRIAFTISFLLQWPLIVAGALRGFLILNNQEVFYVIKSWQFFIVFLCAGLLAYNLLVFVGKMIDGNVLWKFSYYMIIPAFIAFYL